MVVSSFTPSITTTPTIPLSSTSTALASSATSSTTVQLAIQVKNSLTAPVFQSCSTVAVILPIAGAVILPIAGAVILPIASTAINSIIAQNAKKDTSLSTTLV